MSVGGIKADVPLVVAEAEAGAAPVARATAGGATATAIARAQPVRVADGFTQPHVAVADLGAGDAPAQSAALAEFREAKRDLRQAKAIPEGTAGRRREIR